jgi:hypothetical protein
VRRRPRARLALALLALSPLVAQAARAQQNEPVRAVVLGGGGFWDRPWESSAFFSAALARDVPLARGSRFAAAAELHPAFVVRQRRFDRGGSELRPAPALAGLIAYRGGARGPGWGYRIEAGTGLLYSVLGCVPADGTRLNFLDQGGVSIVFRRRHEWSAGYRFVHASNLNLFGAERNPGVSFHALVLSFAGR